jgi:hypothetical protein
MARSDYQTPTQKQIIYSDFATNFNCSPYSNDLAIVTNENSVKQSLMNIVLTMLGQRLYDDTIGSSGQYNLFGLSDDFETQLAVQAIEDAIIQNEPRANIISVIITPNVNGNSYDLAITFSVLNNPSQFNVNISINRIR